MTVDISTMRSAIKKVAWGFFLILFHINIGTIDILPDWAGYVLMVSSLAFIALEEESAKLLRPFGIILIVWNVIEWVLEIFTLSSYLSFISIVPTVLNIYFCFQLFTNLADIAEKYSCPQKKKLLVFRTLYVICTVLSVSMIYLAVFSIDSEIYMVLMIAFTVVNLILALCILFTLFGLSSSLGEIQSEQESANIITSDSPLYQAPPEGAFDVWRSIPEDTQSPTEE